MNIQTLFFGNDDAELDENQGFLDQVFFKTSIFHRARKRQRELVIGRKGSGKTAVCLMLRKAFQEEGLSPVLISPKVMPIEDLGQFQVDAASKDEVYSLAWKRFLLLKIGLKVYERAMRGKREVSERSLQRRIRRLRKILVLNRELEPNRTDKLWGIASPIGRLISKVQISVFGVGGSIETRLPEGKRQYVNDLVKFQQEINSLQSAFDDLHVILLIDRIDELWSDNDQSKLAIIGLIKAVHELNSSLKQTTGIVFLRSDIYDTLRFTDADKFHTLEERVNWTDGELKHLLAMRGKTTARLEASSVEELWNSIFDFNVKGEDSFTYIFRRSLRRPRELIQFCNYAASIAQDKHHPKIFAEDVLEAESQYSIWKLSDLATEFSVQYPYLEDLLKLLEGSPKRFKPSEFFAVLDRHREKLEAKHISFASENNNSILQILYVVGLLGARESEADGERDVFVYDNPKLMLSEKPTIVIHPVFHSGLAVHEVGK